MGNMKDDPGLLPIRGALWPGVRYGCTTRHGGVSNAPWDTFNLGMHTVDASDAVLENRRWLTAILPEARSCFPLARGCALAGAQLAVSGGARPPPAAAGGPKRPVRLPPIPSAPCKRVVIVELHGLDLGVTNGSWLGQVG